MTPKGKKVLIVSVALLVIGGVAAYLLIKKKKGKKEELDAKAEAEAKAKADADAKALADKSKGSTSTTTTPGISVTTTNPVVVAPTTEVINTIDFLASNTKEYDILKKPLYAKYPTDVYNASGAVSYTAKKGDFLGVGVRVLIQGDGTKRVEFMSGNGVKYNVLAVATEIRITK